MFDLFMNACMCEKLVAAFSIPTHLQMTHKHPPFDFCSTYNSMKNSSVLIVHKQRSNQVVLLPLNMKISKTYTSIMVSVVLLMWFGFSNYLISLLKRKHAVFFFNLSLSLIILCEYKSF